MPRICAVIMAGGVGTRFWPRSREKSPKQLLEIVAKGTMIQNTVKRLEGFVNPSDVFIVTNRVQRALVAKQLPHIDSENILVEPVGRNTAPCIGLAALHVRRVDPAAVMVVLPADHLIEDTDEFRRVLTLAAETAVDSQSVLTIGIQPTHPETGYGYIQMYNEDGSHNPYFERGVFKVKTFAEKPSLETAKRFLDSGDFLWNSGMFVWRADVILKKMVMLLPEMYQELMKIDNAIGTSQYQSALDLGYGMMRSISIDYGVMEKAKQVFVIPGNFGWSDIGSWDEVYRKAGKDDNGNSVTGKAILKETKNSLVYSHDRLIATIGVEDLIIVDTPDALLICKRERSQDVKEIADYLKRKQMNEYM